MLRKAQIRKLYFTEHCLLLKVTVLPILVKFILEASLSTESTSGEEERNEQENLSHMGWVVQKLVNFNPGLSKSSRSIFFFKKR